MYHCCLAVVGGGVNDNCSLLRIVKGVSNITTVKSIIIYVDTKNGSVHGPPPRFRILQSTVDEDQETIRLDPDALKNSIIEGSRDGDNFRTA